MYVCIYITEGGPSPIFPRPSCVTPCTPASPCTSLDSPSCIDILLDIPTCPFDSSCPFPRRVWGACSKIWVDASFESPGQACRARNPEAAPLPERGFRGYCYRVLFRHPSIRRIAKQLKATQKKHSRNKVCDSKNG